MKVTKEVLVLIKNEEQDIGTSDVPNLKTFQISERHTDFAAYYLRGQWGIILSQATITINNNTKIFLCNAVIPLDRIYHKDRVFTRNTLQV